MVAFRRTSAIVLASFLAAATSGAALAADPEACKAVRFADVGWTDITATTALASTVLEGLGYAPKTDILAVPVTYASLKNKDIDVFLGNWMPTMEADLKPYQGERQDRGCGAREPRRRQVHPRGDDLHLGRGQPSASRILPISPSTRTSWKTRSTVSSRAMMATVSFSA